MRLEQAAAESIWPPPRFSKVSLSRPSEQQICNEKASDLYKDFRSAGDDIIAPTEHPPTVGMSKYSIEFSVHIGIANQSFFPPNQRVIHKDE